MRRAIVLIAAALLAALFAWPAAPAAAEEAKPQVTEAKGYEIIDQDGNVLASHDATEHMAPASITKIMTAMARTARSSPDTKRAMRPRCASS